jgi:hypothetical protein
LCISALLLLCLLSLLFFLFFVYFTLVLLRFFFFSISSLAVEAIIPHQAEKKRGLFHFGFAGSSKNKLLSLCLLGTGFEFLGTGS